VPTKCPACGEYKAVKNVAQKLGISKPKRHKKRTRKYAHTVQGSKAGAGLCSECRETVSECIIEEETEQEPQEEPPKERVEVGVEA